MRSVIFAVGTASAPPLPGSMLGSMTSLAEKSPLQYDLYRSMTLLMRSLISNRRSIQWWSNQSSVHTLPRFALTHVIRFALLGFFNPFLQPRLYTSQMIGKLLWKRRPESANKTFFAKPSTYPPPLPRTHLLLQTFPLHLRYQACY